MKKFSPRKNLKFKLCVSGAAETGLCGEGSLKKAKILGREIAKINAILVNGATTGFPLWAAIGAKEAGGFTVGLSPASSEREHVLSYKLPTDYMDMIIYTGFGYSGRNLLLTRASDAVITGCGRIGTLNEFTIAFEDGKPIGVLRNSGGTTDMYEDIIERSTRLNPNVIFEEDPVLLIKKLLVLVKKHKRLK